MTKRQKKKLRKRGGLFHYRDWGTLRKFLVCPTQDDAIASTLECMVNQLRMQYVKDIQKMVRLWLRDDTSIEAMKEALDSYEAYRRDIQGTDPVPVETLDALSLAMYKANKRLPIPMSMIYPPETIQSYEEMIKKEEGDENGQNDSRDQKK